MMPARPKVPRRRSAIAAERLQLEIGNPGGNVQPGLALHADRLQRVGIGRTTDQEIAAAADADRRVGADAAVTAGEVATANLAVRRAPPPRPIASAR